MLDRLFANIALTGNLLVRPASHNQCEDIPLSPGQPESQLSSSASRRLYERPDRLDKVSDKCLPKPVLTRHDARNGFEQQFCARIFHDEPSNAELNCRQKFRFIECSRQEDGSHAVSVRFELAHRFKPRFWGHADIEEQKVGIGGLDDSDGLFAGRRFANNAKTRAYVRPIDLFNYRGRDGK
jgi:hypothetical protein